MDEKKYDEKIDEELETIVETKEENEITDSNEESTSDKKKKIKILSAVLAVILVIAAVITGTVGCNTSNKEVEYKVTQIKKEVEYTSAGKPVDPLSLVYIGEKTDKKATKAGIDENLEATAYPVNIDTSRVGDIEVTYTVTDKKSGESKKLTSTFEVVNPDAPVFKTAEKKKTETSDKSDSKKTDKKSDTANSKSNKTADKANGETASKNNSSKSSGNTSSSTQTQQKPAEKKCHDVYHDAEGHWETVVTGQKWIQDTEGYNEEIVVCKCGATFPDDNAWEEHSVSMLAQGDTNHTYSVQTIHHEGTGHYEDITEQKYVIDKQAWTETVCE